MQVISTITDPAGVVTHVGAPAEVPAVAAARAPPQVPLWPGGCDRCDRCDPPDDLDAYDPA